MNKITKTILISLAITALSVIIGLLGELMPDEFKKSVEVFATQTLGISYIKFWISGVVFIGFLLLIFVWKAAINQNPLNNQNASTPPKVIQHGKASMYIKKNKGNIKIR